MTDKSDNLSGFRPNEDDMDKPLFDHRNNASENRNAPISNHSKSKSPHHKKSAPNHNSKPHSHIRPSRVSRKGAGNTAGPVRSPYRLPNNVLPNNQPKGSAGQQGNPLNDLPKRGERLNSNQSQSDDSNKNKSNHNDQNKDSPKSNDHDNKSDKDDKNDKDHGKDSNNDKDDNGGHDNNKNNLTKNSSSDNNHNKDNKGDKDKDKDSDSNKDGDKDKDSDDKDNQDDDNKQDSDKNKSPLKKFTDFITGKKRSKGKSLKSLISRERNNANLPKKPKGPIHGLKDFLDRLKNIIKRILLLLKVYLMALKAWLVMKLVALIQTVLMFLSNVIQWIINMVITIWTFFTGLFGTIGGIVASFFSFGALLSVIAIVGAIFASFIANQQQDSEMDEYRRVCSNARNLGGGDQVDSVTKGSGSWKKKGTKQYKTAHSVFKSWVKLGLDGGAAAGIIGWVAHEGGDFSIIDRAEGHFGNTEKEAGISEGVVPVPSGNYDTGGGGIYQFTPYHKFEPLRSKKWLSADAQSKQVAKELNKNGGWNPQLSIVGVSFMQFAAMKDPVKAVLKWDGYEKGAIDPIMNTADARKADAKAAYKLFNGADFHFNKKKVQSWYHPGQAGGVLDTGGSTQDDSDDHRDPRCNPDQSQDDDDISSNSIVKTAEKEVKEGRHPSGAKYCKWFNVSVGTPWCAIFVSWVLHHTKGYEYIPKNGAVSGFASYFKSKDEDRSYKSTPKPGWLILFDWGGTHNTGTDNSHIGIVTGVKNGKISTIEGNDYDNGDTITKALKNEYSIGDKRISMFAVPHKK